MRLSTFVPFAALTLAALAAGCRPQTCAGDLVYASGRGGEADPGSGFNSSPADAARTISEADIVQLDAEQSYVYAMSKSGSLAIVDATAPSALKLLGTTKLVGQPFEMYRRGNTLLAMSNHGLLSNGTYVQLADEEAGAEISYDQNGGSLLSAVDTSDPANMKVIATLPIPGEVADSRIVGHILYVATYENGACWSCTNGARTVVTTFDVADPAGPKQVDQVSLPGRSSPYGSWATPWKRSIVATANRLYVGGIADLPTSANEGVIQAIDITDPSGHLTLGAKLVTAGVVMNRWQMDEYQGVLRVVSQQGITTSPNGTAYPDIDTFRIESSQSIVRIGHTTMSLPQQEGLKSVRFDGLRAYAITFETVINRDPLFTIDLSDPAAPAQRGELEIPGWVYHLEPRGDRLLGLGLDRNATGGALSVSLFDVSDMSHPRLVVRQAFGPTGAWNDAQITEAVMAEDQNRIQKAFRVFDDGLVVVPYSGLGRSAAGCSGEGGVQLLSWSAANDTILPRGTLSIVGNPRRAFRLDDTSKSIIAVSDSNVAAFSIANPSAPKKTSEVTIGTCVSRPVNGGGGWGEGGGGGRRGSDVWSGSGSSCE